MFLSNERLTAFGHVAHVEAQEEDLPHDARLPVADDQLEGDPAAATNE